MNKLILALCAILFAACGGETQGQRPLVIVNLPDLPDPPNVTIVETTTPTDRPQPTTPCNGACGVGTRCDESIGDNGACVAVEMPPVPNPLLERCREFDYTATKFPRPADEPIELARGDRGLLFGVVLEGCNAEQVERIAIQAPGFAAFSVIQLMNDGRRRGVGTTEVTNMFGIALIALEDVRVGIREKISFFVYGAPNTTTSTGPTNVGLYAVHARRIEDDGIARLSTGYIGEVIQVVESTTPPMGTGLIVSGDSRNPRPQLFVAGTRDVTLLAFNLFTPVGDAQVRRIGFSQRVNSQPSSFAVTDRLYLQDEAGNTVGEVVPANSTPTIIMSPRFVTVNAANSRGTTLFLKANLANICHSCTLTHGGYEVGYDVAQVDAIWADGSPANVTFSIMMPPLSNTSYLYKGVPSVEILLVDGRLSASADIKRFGITAQSEYIDVSNVSFEISLNGVRLTGVELYDVTNPVEVALFSTSLGITGSVRIEARFNNPVTIRGNQFRQFVLRGTFTGVSSGDSVSTVLLGDQMPVFPGSRNWLLGTVDEIQMDPSNSFIWSDRSVPNPSPTTRGWTNGYAVDNLPPRSVPTVLSL